MTQKRWMLICCAALAALLVVGAVLFAGGGDTGAADPRPAASAPEAEPAPAPAPTPKPAVEFADVPAGTRYAPAVRYVAGKGLLGGTSEGVWSPEQYASRGCVATVLHRLAGAPSAAATSFADVKPGDWYAPAVAWAAEEGLLQGRDDGLFHPLDPMDRGELALVLFRRSGQSMSDDAAEEILEQYWDARRVPEGQRQALAWCLQEGLLDTLVSREVHAGYLVTRGQLAQVITALQRKSDLSALVVSSVQTALCVSRSQAQHDALQTAIEDIAKSYGAIGVQVAVLEKGQLTDAFVYGRANSSTKEVFDKKDGVTLVVDTGAMTRDNKLRVASISKVVVAMNAFAMAEHGELDLDGSIGQYWNCTAKNRAYPDTPVSVRSILTHTSSIPMYGDSTSRRYASVRNRLASGDFASLKPGNIGSWGYNNYAFGVLGMTLELAGSRRYDDIADEYFFLPLDIDAGVVPGELDHPELIATLYRHGGEVGWSAQSQRQRKYAYAPGDYGNYFCGGLTASAIDIAKLYGVLAGDGVYEGQRLLGADSVAAMETPLGQPYAQLFQQCHPLRLQSDIYGRHRLYYHTGSAYGVYNVASYDPDTGDGVVVLTTGASATTDSHGIYAIGGKISQTVYAAIAR